MTPTGEIPDAGGGERQHGVPSLDVVILGTNARWPTSDRAVCAAMIMRGADHVLIDCGEGTQRQMMRSVAGLRRLSAILITHCHADHVLGLPGLLATLSDARTEPLVLLGPVGTRALVDGFRVHFGTLPFPLTVREVGPGPRRAPGRLPPARPGDAPPGALAGVGARGGSASGAPAREAPAGARRPPGPARAALARGDDLDVGDGRRITPRRSRAPAARAAGSSSPGTPARRRPSAAAAAGANLLVHEATFLERDRDLADRSGHSTAADAARLAAEAGVGLLALVHRSTRYRAAGGAGRGAGDLRRDGRRRRTSTSSRCRSPSTVLRACARRVAARATERRERRRIRPPPGRPGDRRRGREPLSEPRPRRSSRTGPRARPDPRSGSGPRPPRPRPPRARSSWRPGEHLVQRAERLALEAQALGRGGHPHRRGTVRVPHVEEPGRGERGLQRARRTEAERAWLAGQGRRQLGATPDDPDRDREEPVALRRASRRSRPRGRPGRSARACRSAPPAGRGSRSGRRARSPRRRALVDRVEVLAVHHARLDVRQPRARPASAA